MKKAATIQRYAVEQSMARMKQTKDVISIEKLQISLVILPHTACRQKQAAIGRSHAMFVGGSIIMNTFLRRKQQNLFLVTL